MKKIIGNGIELVELGGNFYEYILNKNDVDEIFNDIEVAFTILEEAFETVHIVIDSGKGQYMHLFHKKGSNKIDKKVVTENKFDFTETKVEKENVQLPKKISNRELKRQRGREKALARQNKKN